MKGALSGFLINKEKLFGVTHGKSVFLPFLHAGLLSILCSFPTFMAHYGKLSQHGIPHEDQTFFSISIFINFFPIISLHQKIKMVKKKKAALSILFMNTDMIIRLSLLHHVTAITAGYIHNDK